MNKKSLLIFAVGAVVGWTAAQRVFGDTQSRPKASSEISSPTSWQDVGAESTPTRSVTAGGDPFRGAFKGARAEVNSHVRDLAESETQVADASSHNLR